MARIAGRISGISTAQAGPDRARRHLGFAVSKRVLDIALALVGLVLAAPVLGFCAAWIKAADGGPVFYRQWRVGHHGWLFRLCKMRTMVLDAERRDGASFARCNDPRVLHGCQWMRKSHLDELPQLWNVLRGQMSLVGPRPERPEILEWLTVSLPGVNRRLAAKPGLTGLAQLRNGYTNDLAGARGKLANDLRYLRRRNLRMELGLLVRTVPKVWDQASL